MQIANQLIEKNKFWFFFLALTFLSDIQCDFWPWLLNLPDWKPISVTYTNEIMSKRTYELFKNVDSGINKMVALFPPPFRENYTKIFKKFEENFSESRVKWGGGTLKKLWKLLFYEVLKIFSTNFKNFKKKIEHILW